MFNYNSLEIQKMADSLNYVKNTLEKVLRLCDVLQAIKESKIGKMLVLKGGTAINLFIFEHPRLSVDIDMDFCLDASREEMLEKRKEIDWFIKSFMRQEGYVLSEKSKFVHTLDSYVYTYLTTSNSTDLIKIEINYSNRMHILEITEKKIALKIKNDFEVYMENEIELFGSKLSALIGRTTPRDIFDSYNLFHYLQENKNINLEKTFILLKKIAIFYTTISAELPFSFDALLNDAIEKINSINYKTIKVTLIPTLTKGEKLDLVMIKNYLIQKLKEVFVLDNNEKQFVNQFNNGIYQPSLLFEQPEIVSRIENHPMALWKMMHNK